MIRNYQKLDAYRVSMQLVKQVYLLTKEYPKEELYSLTSQTRRAAISIPSNIAEGIGRQYKKDTLQFMYIARGSVYELETHLNIALMTGMIAEVKLNNLIPLIDDTIRLLNGFINYLEKSKLK
jgi:four helix bundle protein